MSALSFGDAAERIKSSLDIIDIIQRHVILKKSGRNYTGKCPFHNDKSPSMNVSREKGIFKCFACGVGGDALTFLMKIENRTFGEVIRELAQEQGLEILQEGRDPDAFVAQKDAKQKILELNEAANRWFQEQFKSPEAEIVRQYLTGRYPDDLDREAVLERFQIGYALPGWEHLTPYLKERFEFVQASPDLLINAGLSNSREHGQGHYDRFRNRLIIPIHDDRGQVVAFGGRTLSDEDKPKYLNSPETAVYKKSQVLYGFYQAKETIRQHKAAIVMEGYFDVITAHLAGVTEAIGSCGTAMTESHLRLLTRFGAETVYLAFDSDEAGIKAALSAITLIEPYLNDNADLHVKVVIVPNGKDPDDFIRQQGGLAFRDLLAHARSHLAFKCDMAIRDLALQTSEGRIQAASRLTPILTEIRRPTVLAEYLKLYSQKIGVAEEALALEVKRLEQSRNPVVRPQWQEFKKSGNKKAISKYGSTSFKSNQPLATDNLTDLRGRLPSRQEVSEKNLLMLTFYSPESFFTMMRVFKMSVFNPSPQALFSDPLHQELLAGMMDLDLSPETASATLSTTLPGTLENNTTKPPDHSNHVDNGPVGTLIEKMNHLYFDKPDVLHRLVDLVMAAESFGDSLGLGELKGSPLREKVVTLAEQQVRQLAHCRQKEKLQTIKTFASQNEGDAIELIYEFNDRLAEMHSPAEEASTPV